MAVQYQSIADSPHSLKRSSSILVPPPPLPPQCPCSSLPVFHLVCSDYTASMLASIASLTTTAICCPIMPWSPSLRSHTLPPRSWIVFIGETRGQLPTSRTSSHCSISLTDTGEPASVSPHSDCARERKSAWTGSDTNDGVTCRVVPIRATRVETPLGLTLPSGATVNDSVKLCRTAAFLPPPRSTILPFLAGGMSSTATSPPDHSSSLAGLRCTFTSTYSRCAARPPCCSGAAPQHTRRRACIPSVRSSRAAASPPARISSSASATVRLIFNKLRRDEGSHAYASSPSALSSFSRSIASTAAISFSEILLNVSVAIVWERFFKP
mmetsp:Transcript_48564/g.97170  ORF Transcript_48564/g.97170 Transcript_48564/m.97170 type:complete len:325 (+) Transcript_48564:647-1621(+)